MLLVIVPNAAEANGVEQLVRLALAAGRPVTPGSHHPDPSTTSRRRSVARPSPGTKSHQGAHRGSADFALRALKVMAPVVSLISSGEESSRKEHIHPRATLMGALGQVSHGDMGIVLSTELAAFFERRGMSNSDGGTRFFGFAAALRALARLGPDP